MLSGRGLCDELITHPEESYRLWCVVVCDLETSRIGAPYIYDISSLRVKLHVLQTLNMDGLLFLNLYFFLICCFIKFRYFPTFRFSLSAQSPTFELILIVKGAVL